ncbi:uncharacterized protein V6R79_000662 [Siganus canaliculatus]
MVTTILRSMGAISSLTRPRALMKDMKRRIYSKPPRDRIGAAQSFFVMSVFAVAMLTPAAWILHHLPDYRQRCRQSSRSRPSSP